VLALQRATHHTLQALSTALADLRLTAAETNVLANLAAGGALKPSTLTNVLDRLEDRGYLSRELDAQDRRSFRLTLTKQGTVIAGRIGTAIAELENRALAGLSPSQLAGFHAALTAFEKAC
jgi:MarR family transcriptional regulator, organic hydroperoxide resistance regulator